MACTLRPFISARKSQLRWTSPSRRHSWLLVLTTFEGETHALRAIKAGAAGYMLKSMVRKDMLGIVQSVFAGRRHIPPCVAEAMALHIQADALSHREVEVLKQVAAGNSNRQIGLELNISEETVKVHMKNLMAKLEANDRTHAVIMGLARGIIDAPMRPAPYNQRHHA